MRDIVISVVNNSYPDEPEKFLAVDDSSGGCLYWSAWLSSAKFFASVDEAKRILDGSEFNDPWFDGAPLMIHSGLGLCTKRPAATGTFAIKRIKFDVIDSETVTGTAVVN